MSIITDDPSTTVITAAVDAETKYTGGLNPEPTEEQFAKFRRAQQITDPGKLAAMLPSWLKRELAEHAPPKPFHFTPGLPPRFPSGCHGTRILPVIRKIPMLAYVPDDAPPEEHKAAMLAYIKEFAELNGPYAAPTAKPVKVAKARKVKAIKPASPVCEVQPGTRPLTGKGSLKNDIRMLRCQISRKSKLPDM